MATELLETVKAAWDEDILQTLEEYIRIPNQSPHFDSEWASNGYTQQAADLLMAWVKKQNVPGLSIEMMQVEGKTPLIICEHAGNCPGPTTLLYGHADKQPPMDATQWDTARGIGPYTPKLIDGKLYGRGGADDGYAIFAAIIALQLALQQQWAIPRCIILVEFAEESGSRDLPFYVERLRERIGSVGLVVCLDSGAGDYARLWGTTSLRGVVNGTLTVTTMREGLHSGRGSGVVPDVWRCMRQLIGRLEDETTGLVKPAGLQVTIPPEVQAQAAATGKVLGAEVWEEFPLVEGMQPQDPSPQACLLRRTWQPALTTIGAEGLPPPRDAGNVLRPTGSLVLSMRLPPTLDCKAAAEVIKTTLEAAPTPQGCQVSFTPTKMSRGWCAPPLAPWLEASVAESSRQLWQNEPGYIGEGGSIPFMRMLHDAYPTAQFLITGVLGPGSNAHSVNEFLHVEMAQKITVAVAHCLRDAATAWR